MLAVGPSVWLTPIALQPEPASDHAAVTLVSVLAVLTLFVRPLIIRRSAPVHLELEEMHSKNAKL